MSNKERIRLIKQIKDNISSLENKINRLEEKKVDASSKFQKTINYWDKLIEDANDKHKAHIKNLELRKEKSKNLYQEDCALIKYNLNNLEQQLDIELEHLQNQEMLAKLQD